MKSYGRLQKRELIASKGTLENRKKAIQSIHRNIVKMTYLEDQNKIDRLEASKRSLFN